MSAMTISKFSSSSCGDTLERYIFYLNPLYHKFKKIFGMDKRSLALCRIGVAAVVLADVWNRSDEAYAQYSDHGILPRTDALEYFWNYYWFCFNMLSGEVFWQYFLFFLEAICAFSMLIGYRTRVSTILTWMFVVSVQARNFLIGHGGDVVMRMYIFWMIFMPLGSYYSIDSVLKKVRIDVKKNQKAIINSESDNEYNSKTPKDSDDESYVTEYTRTYKPSTQHYTKPYKKPDTYVLSGATLAMFCQFTLLYVFSYIHKTGAEWTTENTATFYALQLDYFRTPIGEFFLSFPELCKFMTWSVLRWEGFGPLFFFVPFQNHHFKMFAFLGFFSMHMGFQASMRLGIFGWICAFGVLCTIPGWYWNFVLNRLKTRERMGFTLYYNIPGSFQHKFAEAVKTFFLIEETRISCVHSHLSPNERVIEEGKGHNSVNRNLSEEMVGDNVAVLQQLPSLSITSWLLVLEANGTVHRNFDAFVTVCRLSPLLTPFYYILRVPVITRFCEIGVAKSMQAYSFTSEVLNFDVKQQYHNSEQFYTSKTFLPESVKERKRLRKTIFKSARIGVKTLVTLFTLFLMFICISWNLGNIGQDQYITEDMRTIAWVFRLDQSWSMFSPRPPSTHWYYIIEGHLVDKTEVELFKNESLFTWTGTTPVTWDKPDPFHPSMRSHRWFKFFEQLNNHANHPEIRSLFGKYICREWNARHSGGSKLEKFTIWFMSEVQNLDGTRFPVPKQSLWNHVCFYRAVQ